MDISYHRIHQPNNFKSWIVYENNNQVLEDEEMAFEIPEQEQMTFETYKRFECRL